MRGCRPSSSLHLGFVAWVLLASLLSAHTGLAGLVERGLHAVAEAHAGEHASEHAGGCDDPAGGCEERCPGDAPDGTCPPQCDDCRCCAGASLVLVPEPRSMNVPALVALVQPACSDHVPIGTPQRIFRPPRPAPAC